MVEGTATDETSLEYELIVLVRKNFEQPTRLGPSDLNPVRKIVGEGAIDYTLVIGGFRRESYDDVGIMDLSIAVAEANQWTRIHRLLDLRPELFYFQFDRLGT